MDIDWVKNLSLVALFQELINKWYDSGILLSDGFIFFERIESNVYLPIVSWVYEVVCIYTCA